MLVVLPSVLLPRDISTSGEKSNGISQTSPNADKKNYATATVDVVALNGSGITHFVQF